MQVWGEQPKWAAPRRQMQVWGEQPKWAAPRRQERHIWDSVKKATFILGSGLFVFAAFRNSVTWHLQQFWGASGDFWQSQWGKAYSFAQGNEWLLFIFGAMVIPTLAFWLVNGLLLIVDVTGKPQLITRYKIQAGHNQRSGGRGEGGGGRGGVDTQIDGHCWPALSTFQHWSARLFHHPTLYRHFHKKHHEWTAPIGIISLYAHPIEHVFSNMLPTMVGPILLRSHVATVMLWFSLALLISTISHCGYHLPLLPSPEFHDFHHLRFNQCFGVLGVLDRLHQTDTAFRASSAYERHTLLLGLDPLSETIPDSPKRK
ncbi:fatty acid hydroxylase domain-containing protein 2 [Leucoraja erinacea]|uniref:fatty acid hydroxylase domain-containing protein 2 n=1 Tax=Leucoraja erinaceus TaxID=7782 RepID=UPI002458585E|nr:fatty acid hydroxylase domain-containing protein 2 [Leucoraja erinacea]